ncbi:MAG: hypothetical protein Q8O92_06895 [Candidatus Latescibacter sp.]|nr:hypothetical protein [Candidatus Latescibacter sp.]
MPKNNTLNTAFMVISILLVFFTTSSPATAADAWKYRMPITLTHRDAGTAGLAPVDVTFSLFSDRCTRPEKEIRLVLETASGEKEIPFQLSRLFRWTKDTESGRSLPTQNGMITFFDEAPGNGDARYFLLYGNPDAAAPSYPTDLKVSGKGPAWTIENSKMVVQLHGKKPGIGESTNHDSGQLSAVTLKSKPDAPFKTAENVMHWNPCVFVPARGWIHSFAWDPPEVCEIETGPLYTEIRRSGAFPGIPEVHLAVTYRIFTRRAYVESGTVVDVREPIGVVAIRNDQLIFSPGFFTHIGWDDGGRTVTHPLSSYKPVNKHGDILRLADTVPFLTFYNPAKGVGAATIRESFSAIGPNGAPPTLFDNATYVSNGDLQYWFRPLIYFHVGWDRKQLITVPQGALYSERNLYLFYEPKGNEPVAEVVNLSKAVRSMPGLKIGEYVLPPER